MSIPIVIGIAAVQMPYIALDTVCAGTIASSVTGISAEENVKCMLLEWTGGFAKETCADQEDKVGHDNEENWEGY